MARKDQDRSIEEYRRKRDFSRTPEPPPASARREGEPVFVVHRHDASRLHYDLRVEVGGVLRSWAVPKGFSYDPKEKHLAIRTEDHPIEYEDFHGVIPKGQYGAGTMTIWDRGRYRLVQLADWQEADERGEVKLVLYGRRLRGEWHLVRTKQEPGSWLLFKSRDRYAGPAQDSAVGIDLARAVERALPTRLALMEPGGAREPFSDPAWLFEAVFAGRRALARKRGDAALLVGVARAPDEVLAALAQVRAEDALLDGLLVAPDDAGRPSLERLEARLSGAAEHALVYYAWDLLHFDDFDLRPLPLVERKRALRSVVVESRTLLFLDHVPGEGLELARAAQAAGLGALQARRADAPWSAGPSPDWLALALDGAPAAPEPAPRARRRAARADGRRVRLSNLEKVYWPAEGFTKGDLIGWYERVADLLLPYLADRPVHMNRFPDGIDGKSFYQREAKEDTPEWVRTVLVASEHRGAELRQIVCQDRDTLLWLANQGSIDLHPWLSRAGSLDAPDWCVIDLDPKLAPFAHVIAIARRTGELLHAIGLRPLLKTSGKTGLHVYVPLAPGYTYEQSRLFAEGVARAVVRELPDIATVERTIPGREGKVYVDFGQNRRSQTVVPPYSVRPVRGATVSAPLAWDELTDDLTPARFTIQTMVPRLAERGDLFRPALDDPQDLLPAAEALERTLRG